MNRRQRRQLAHQVVKRGDASGHETRVARSMFAKNMREHEEQQQEKTTEDRAQELGLEVRKTKLWTP